MIQHRSYGIPAHATGAKFRAKIVQWLGAYGAGQAYILTALVDEDPMPPFIPGLLGPDGKPKQRMAPSNPDHPEWEVTMIFDGDEPVAGDIMFEPPILLGTLLTPNGPGYIYVRRA